MTLRTALITGASRGIGKATARKFALSGFRLILVGSDGNRLADAQQEIAEKNANPVEIIQADLSDESQLNALLERMSGERVDVLVNNAAWRSIETLRTIDLATWNKTIAVNLTAPALLARTVAAGMESRGEGLIINISSVMQNRAAGTSPAYVVCKGGLEALTREIAVTYGRAGIRSVSVAPGFIESDMSSDYTDPSGNNVSRQLADELVNYTPLQRAGTPMEIAEVIYWLSTGGAAFISGTTITVDGGFLANFNSYTSKQKLFPSEY